MKKRLIIYPIIFIIIVLAFSVPTQSSIDEEFLPYVAYFNHEYGKSVFDMNLIVKFADLKGATAGECQRMVSVLTKKTIRRRILIDAKIWGHLEEIERINLVVHELAHCVMLKEHDTKMLANNCPASIMYPEIISPQCLEENWDLYLVDLFGKRDR